MTVQKIQFDSNGEVIEYNSNYQGGNQNTGSNLAIDQSQPRTGSSPTMGTQRVSVNGDNTKVEHTTHQSVTKADIYHREHTDILSTATDETGRPLEQFAINDYSRVTFGGVEMQAMQAAQVGLIKKGLDGHYYLPSADVETRTAQEQLEDEFNARHKAQQPEEPEPEIADLPEEIEGKIEAIGQAMHPQFADSLVNQVINGDEIDERSLADITYEHGLNAHMLIEDVRTIEASMQEQANNYVLKQGVSDVDHFYDWINSNKRGETLNAMRLHFYKKDISVYKPLVAAYQLAMKAEANK